MYLQLNAKDQLLFFPTHQKVPIYPTICNYIYLGLLDIIRRLTLIIFFGIMETPYITIVY